MNSADLDNNLEAESITEQTSETIDQFLRERFVINIDAFQKYLPEFSRYFKTYRPNKKLSFFSLENGIPNLLLNNTVFYKSDDPVTFCKERLLYLMQNIKFHQSCFEYENDIYGQIYDKYINEGINRLSKEKKETTTIKDFDTLPLVVVSGIGLGYILGELYERVNVKNLVIIEPDPDIFFASLHTFDWKNLLDYIFSEHLSIDIIIDDNPQLCFDTFASIMQSKGVFLTTSPFLLLHYSNEFNTEFSRIFNYQTPGITSLLGFFDDYAFGISHGAFAFSQGNNHFSRKEVSLEKYKDIPVFVIGSGASLDTDIHFIQRFQDKAVIIACGTAVDALFHTGIKPDFWANTERVPEMYELIESIPDPHFFEDITLISSEVCHPLVQKKFLKAIFFGKNNEPFFPYIQKSLPKKLENIQESSYMNPLVGNMGISSAATLGFRKLYLFGMDNGLKVDDTQVHSKFASLFQNKGVNEENVFNYVCEGNFGHKCKTNLKYLQAIDNIKNVIDSISEAEDKQHISVYNCSDGALIPHTISVHSQELQEEFCRLPSISKKEICNYIYEVKCKKVHIDYDEMKALLKNNEFIDVIDSVIRELSNINKFNNRKDWLKTLSNISSSLNQAHSPTETFHKEMIAPSLQSMFILIINAMYLCKDFKCCKDISQHLVNMSMDFLEECKDIFDYLPDYIMGEHRKYYANNKVGRDMPSISAPPMPPVGKLIRTEYKDPMTEFCPKYK